MKKKLLPLAFVTLSFLCISAAWSQDKVNFSKNGEIHDQVIQSWNTHYRNYFASELNKRLFQNGDVYVLYDAQIGGLQSFVEMTRRCKDIKQIGELVDLLTPVFSQLKPISGESTGWICTGGSICTAYGFIGKEVPLCSVQFLGLLGALATNITENIPAEQRSAAENIFLTNTYRTMAVQLNRWLTDSYFSSVERRLPMAPADVTDGSSRHFFTDRDLWYLTVLSDLSELHQSGIEPAADGKIAFEDLQGKKEGIKKIFSLFLARTFLSQSDDGVRAELDKGFWKHYFDNRYAGYSGPESPVSWTKGSNGQWEMITRVKWDSTYLSNNISWDISHARRLVPALETFARNRENIKKVWGFESPSFDPVALRRAYANQIVEKIWNGNMTYPQFSNFWSGDNGWYRVAYANQTGRQFAGNPPFGLNTSMPKGGYPVWGAYQPVLKDIFIRIFELSRSDDPAAKSFIDQNYKGLFVSSQNGTSASPIPSLSFLSDMVELPAN